MELINSSWLAFYRKSGFFVCISKEQAGERYRKDSKCDSVGGSDRSDRVMLLPGGPRIRSSYNMEL